MNSNKKIIDANIFNYFKKLLEEYKKGNRTSPKKTRRFSSCLVSIKPFGLGCTIRDSRLSANYRGIIINCHMFI